MASRVRSQVVSEEELIAQGSALQGLASAFGPNIFVMARMQFLNQISEAGMQMIQHMSMFHPSKKSPEFIMCMKKLAKGGIDEYFDKFLPVFESNIQDMFDQHQFAYVQFANTQQTQSVCELLRTSLKRLYLEDKLHLFLHGMLSLAVAKPGDPVRHASLAFGGDIVPEDWEEGGKCVDSEHMGDTTVHPLFFKFAHDLARIPGMQKDALASIMHFSCNWFLMFLQNCYLYFVRPELEGDNDEEEDDPMSAHLHRNNPHKHSHSHHHSNHHHHSGCGCGHSHGPSAAVHSASAKSKIQSKTYCDQCGLAPGLDDPSAAGLKVCSRCRKVYYCSVECQKKAWKTHKAMCIPTELSSASNKK